MAKLGVGVGFHMGLPNFADGIGKYWNRLAQNGHAIIAKGVRNAGPIKEVQDLARRYPDIPAYGIYRVDKFSWNDDVPDYNADPEQMAKVYWDYIDSRWPEELDKDFAWVEFPNEVDKSRSEWVGRLAVACGKEALQRGYKYICPAWSVGEPEPEDWHHKSWYEYFRMCERHPDRLGISVHEYTRSANRMMVNETPYYIGRITFMNEAAKSQGITPPTAFVTEWGYAHVSAPRASIAVPDMIQAIRWYIENAPNVKGLIIWCLDSSNQWKAISRTVNSYIDPLGKAIVETDWPEQSTPQPPKQKHKVVIFKAAQEHNQDEYLSIVDIAYNEYKRTVTFSTDDMLTMLAAGNDESYAVIFDPELPSQQEAMQRCIDFGYSYQIRHISSFPFNIELGHLFNYRYRLTSPFDAKRSYANKLHEGADYDIVGTKPDYKVPVLCTYPGVVSHVEEKTSGYGKHVVVKHESSHYTFFTWYCHLDDIYVAKNDVLKKGDAVGEIGNTGNSFGEHVHFNLQIPGLGADGYYVDGVVDPELFMPSGRDRLPLYTEEVTFDMLDYIRGDGRMYEVQHASGATETFQTQKVSDREFFLVKNGQYEHFYNDDQYIWRAEDTSPGPAPDYAERPGDNRWYIQYEIGDAKARWCKRFMSVGETYTGPGHHVDYFYKDNCQRSNANDGPATNIVTFVEHLTEFWPYGRNFVLDDVIELKTNTKETMWFARGFGLVGWENSEGLRSKISEIHYGRPDLVREQGCFSNI